MRWAIFQTTLRLLSNMFVFCLVGTRVCSFPIQLNVVHRLHLCTSQINKAVPLNLMLLQSTWVYVSSIKKRKCSICFSHDHPTASKQRRTDSLWCVIMTTRAWWGCPLHQRPQTVQISRTDDRHFYFLLTLSTIIKEITLTAPNVECLVRPFQNRLPSLKRWL